MSFNWVPYPRCLAAAVAVEDDVGGKQPLEPGQVILLAGGEEATRKYVALAHEASNRGRRSSMRERALAKVCRQLASDFSTMTAMRS